jgi:hypothetical protein
MRAMEPTRETLVMYGAASTAEPLEWAWADGELAAAGTYWAVPPTPSPGAHPHPRPVWGVWRAPELHLSVGSPVLARALVTGAPVTAHLDSGTDVVVVEGTVTGHTTDADLVAAYDAKYEYRYDVDEYGPLTTVRAERVLAWRSAGPAGRDGFRRTARWRY